VVDGEQDRRESALKFVVCLDDGTRSAERRRRGEAAFMRIRARYHELMPSDYEQGNIPRSRRADWDRVLNGVAPDRRALSAYTDYEIRNVSPAQAEPWIRAGYDLETTLMSIMAHTTVQATAHWRAQGWSEPAAIALLEEHGTHIDVATFANFPLRYAAIQGQLWPGLWRVFEQTHDAPMDFVAWLQAAITVNQIPSREFVRDLIAMAEGVSASPLPVVIPLRLYGIASWRHTQGIYRFDSTLRAELIATEIDLDTPSSVLDYLPEQTLWIEHDPVDTQLPMIGSFVTVVRNFTEVDKANSALVVTSFRPSETSTVVVPLGATIGEALRNTSDPTILRGDSVRCLQRTLSLLLYLTSADPDLIGTARVVKGTKTRHGVRLFCPQTPQIWEAGTRIGPALRTSRVKYDASRTQDQGSTVRPHVRRAHWHRFRWGPRGEPVRLRTKWLPPLFVNVRAGDEMGAAIRRVDADTAS
jgi:hypothetical protein